MDLRPYGINYTLGKELPLFNPDHIAPITFKREQFHFPSDSYKVRRTLGQGTYGTTLEVESVRSGARYALKLQRYDDVGVIDNIVRESIMNILMEKESATEQHGPYVSRFYEIGHIVDSKAVVMRIQLLDGTLGDYLIQKTKQENDTVIPKLLIQVSNIIEFFQTRLKLSHRDLKSDNVMYELIDGEPYARLIDFGLTCLTWNDIHISTSTFFPKDHTCLRSTRDMSQFIMELLLDFESEMSEKLYNTLGSIVTFHVHTSKCRLDKYCPLEGLKEWVNSYDFLNRINVENPHGSPNTVRSAMVTFLKDGGKKHKTRKHKSGKN
jgi:serine/threonine protein kinase